MCLVTLYIQSGCSHMQAFGHGSELDGQPPRDAEYSGHDGLPSKRAQTVEKFRKPISQKEVAFVMDVQKWRMTKPFAH